MARNCITSLLSGFMLLCTLTAVGAQQSQPQAQPRENIGDQIPQSWGGLPPDAPARPKTVLPTPAVHDIPPPRATKPMSDAEQLRAERELSALRARQEELKDPNAAKKADAASAANAAAIEGARKKAGNPKPKAPKQGTVAR
jgi:hypothetical protein